ncbi:MAG: MmgE/PrpD family protein, partial [Sciscionella sp.]
FGNATVATALALAEQYRSEGRALVTALAVGFEVGARIGSWLGAPFQVEDGRVVGWHELGGPAAAVTWASVGAAASIARLDALQANHAFGIAGANCPQPAIRKWAASDRQPMYKYADAGWCAQIGVSAALLADSGSTGYLDILDGDDGFWRLYGSPGHNDNALLDGLGTSWQILNTTYKAWPCCRWIHHPLTAFTRLLQEYALEPQEIDRVTVRANPLALTDIFRDQQPADTLTAEFSHPHAVAVTAFGIPPGPRWYEPEVMMADHIKEFRGRVSVEPEPRSSNIVDWMGGGQWRGIPGGVDVFARGEVFSATADNALGDPWSEGTVMSTDQLVNKFRAMVGPERCGLEVTERCVDAALNADTRGEVTSWMADLWSLSTWS